MWTRTIDDIREISTPDLFDLHSMHTSFVHSSIRVVSDALNSLDGIRHVYGHVQIVLDDIEARLGQIEFIRNEMAARLNRF